MIGSKWDNYLGVHLSSEILRETGYAAGDKVSVVETEKDILIQKVMRPKKMKAAGILKGYVKRHVSDEEMRGAWEETVSRRWKEKDS